MPKEMKAIIEVPVGPAPPKEHYTSRHLNVQLDPEQATMLVRIKNGLDQSHARLKNGRPVYNQADTVRYILENFEV